MLENKRFETDIIFYNSIEQIPKTGCFPWFLMFPRGIEKCKFNVTIIVHTLLLLYIYIYIYVIYNIIYIYI